MTWQSKALSCCQKGNCLTQQIAARRLQGRPYARTGTTGKTSRPDPCRPVFGPPYLQVHRDATKRKDYQRNKHVSTNDNKQC